MHCISQAMPPVALLGAQRLDHPRPMQKCDYPVFPDAGEIGLDVANWTWNLQGVIALLLPHLPPVKLVANMPYGGYENKPNGTCDDQLYMIWKMHGGIYSTG